MYREPAEIKKRNDVGRSLQQVLIFFLNTLFHATDNDLFIYYYYYLPEITMRQSRVSKHKAGHETNIIVLNTAIKHKIPSRKKL